MRRRTPLERLTERMLSRLLSRADRQAAARAPRHWEMVRASCPRCRASVGVLAGPLGEVVMDVLDDGSGPGGLALCEHTCLARWRGGFRFTA